MSDLDEVEHEPSPVACVHCGDPIEVFTPTYVVHVGRSGGRWRGCIGHPVFVATAPTPADIAAGYTPEALAGEADPTEWTTP